MQRWIYFRFHKWIWKVLYNYIEGFIKRVSTKMNHQIKGDIAVDSSWLCWLSNKSLHAKTKDPVHYYSMINDVSLLASYYIPGWALCINHASVSYILQTFRLNWCFRIQNSKWKIKIKWKQTEAERRFQAHDTSKVYWKWSRK